MKYRHLNDVREIHDFEAPCSGYAKATSHLHVSTYISIYDISNLQMEVRLVDLQHWRKVDSGASGRLSAHRSSQINLSELDRVDLFFARL
jgi:hypothetical protein